MSHLHHFAINQPLSPRVIKKVITKRRSFKSIVGNIDEEYTLALIMNVKANGL